MTADDATLDVTETQGRLLIRAAGNWIFEAPLPDTAPVLGRITEADVTGVVLDAEAVGRWDSAFLLFVIKVDEACRVAEIEFDTSRVPEGPRHLLAMSKAVPRHEAAQPRRSSWLADATAVVRLTREQFAQLANFLGDLGPAFVRMGLGRARVPWRDFVGIFRQTTFDALAIVLLINFLIGLILAFVGVQQLAAFAAELYVADFVALATTREMAAVMTAIVMAGRTGAAFAAQLGTMMVNEEIDALRTLGIDPIEYLVVPRVLALVVAMPLLYIYGSTAGLVGGALVGIPQGDLSVLAYFQETKIALAPKHVLVGLAKSACFGAIVAGSGCMRGLLAGRGAAEVGNATTAAVVEAIIWIVAFDAYCAVVTQAFGI